MYSEFRPEDKSLSKYPVYNTEINRNGMLKCRFSTG